MPGEEKGLLLPEKSRVGNKNISADAGFKDPIALRVRKRFLFGKYPCIRV